jgi:crotonobetainyl-CoA:carnitine CoA-transferase CaiB-like acyl-CoA transferase
VPNKLPRLGGLLSESGMFDPIETWEQFLTDNRCRTFSARGASSRWPARPPEFGEQTEEVLAEFGFSKDEIAELRQRGVI